MKITDSNGRRIEITNLVAAIKQAELYNSYYHEPPRQKSDKVLQAYWKDIHDKLLNLKSQLNQEHNEQSGK